MSENKGNVVTILSVVRCDGETCALNGERKTLPPGRRWTPDEVEAFLSGTAAVRSAMLKEHGL